MSHFSQRYDNVAVLPDPTANNGIGSANPNANRASGGNSNSSNSHNDYNANNTFGNAIKGPPSIGLAVDGLWINLD